MPRLEEWWVIPTTGSGYALCGKIFNDTRLPESSVVQTSRIKRIDFEKNEAETMNTVYQLGKCSPHV